MLLINVGIMIGAYIGVRLFEHHHQKQLSIEQIDIQQIGKKQDSHKIVIAKDNSNLQLVKSDGSTDSTVVNAKKHDHHVIVSSTAIGLSFISHFYPPLKILTFGMIIYSSIPMLKEAEYSLFKEKRLKNDTLSSIVTIMTAALGQYFASAIQLFAYHMVTKWSTKAKIPQTKC
ncbi:membrane protein [Beggiatoa sp. PS]|nr:membrane protein [Beggiatoa sp. PS]